MESVVPRKKFRDRVELRLLRLKAIAYSLSNIRDLFRVIKLRNQHSGIQLRPAELIKVFNAINEFEHCRMLVFGLGNDSPFWCDANENGRTTFLEDYQPWYDKITKKYPDIEAYPVTYPNSISRWKELLDQPEQLVLDLPDEITNQSWDVILVDGPRGNNFFEETPGRMSSIYTASQLVGEKGYVFVHDAERTVENTYAQHYLGREHFIEKVRGRATLLIYRF